MSCIHNPFFRFCLPSLHLSNVFVVVSLSLSSPFVCSFTQTHSSHWFYYHEIKSIWEDHSVGRRRRVECLWLGCLFHPHPDEFPSFLSLLSSCWRWDMINHTREGHWLRWGENVSSRLCHPSKAKKSVGSDKDIPLFRLISCPRVTRETFFVDILFRMKFLCFFFIEGNVCDTHVTFLSFYLLILSVSHFNRFLSFSYNMTCFRYIYLPRDNIWHETHTHI